MFHTKTVNKSSNMRKKCKNCIDSFLQHSNDKVLDEIMKHKTLILLLHGKIRKSDFEKEKRKNVEMVKEEHIKKYYQYLEELYRQKLQSKL